MAASFERTCWRDVRIDHPPEWEVVVASGPDDPGRLTFTDRRYHRLDVKWRTLKYVPSIELMLSRHQKRDKTERDKRSPLATGPAPWKGIVNKTSDGWIVHAMRFFRQARLLVEVSLIWPGRRDISLENAVLASATATAMDRQDDSRLWQAMGLSVTCPADYDLRQASPKVGRIQWDFSRMTPNGKIDKQGGLLRIARIAMPDYWLKGRPIRDWLTDQLPADARSINQRRIGQGRHLADEIVSAIKLPLVARARGLQSMRLDLAWICPTEGRVYHVQFTQRRRDERIALPVGWEVSCCRPVPSLAVRRNVG